jgi:hypothetical protein
VQDVAVWLGRWTASSSALVASAGSFAVAATLIPAHGGTNTTISEHNLELLQHTNATQLSRVGGTIDEPLEHVNKNFTICAVSFTFAPMMHTYSLIFTDFP